MSEKKRNIKEYKEESKKFGKIAVLSLYLYYKIHLGEKTKLSEIPNKVIKLAESLGMNIFPKKLRS